LGIRNEFKNMENQWESIWRKWPKKISQFEKNSNQNKKLFSHEFGFDLLNKVAFSVDNATANSGYTPVTTLVMNQIVIIKLGIAEDASAVQIAYQLSHELIYCFSNNKPPAGEYEEAVCSTASFVMVPELFPNELWIYYVKNLTDKGYVNE
jgi:hypothetical protein